jgi:shikimate kinase
MNSRLLENVFLTGFMGVGKTTVGRLLAELLNCPFADFDEMIVQREKRPIAEIFSDSGESYFRNCESKLLYELDAFPCKVYATGGGIVMREKNRTAMRNLGKIVYLNSPWPALQARLIRSKERPLVDPKKGWVEVKKLWVKRQPFYADADLVVLTEGCGPLQVAEKIAEDLIGNRTS